MTSPDLPRLSFGALFAEQVRVVALALRREAVLAGAALAVICGLTVMMGLKYNEQLDFVPDITQPTLLVALLLPFAVWKGDPIFGGAFLWTMPVRRQTAAIAKVLAGGLWLMVAILVTTVLLGLSAATTGGAIGISQTRLVGSSVGGAAQVAWTTPAWTWLVPFVSALLLYLASSAALLGLRHPIRWLAGVVVATFILMFVAAGVGQDGAFEQVMEAVSETLIHGRFGLDFALTAGTVTQVHEFDKPGPGSYILWSTLPEFGRWAMAALVWFGTVSLVLALAIRRHWER